MFKFIPIWRFDFKVAIDNHVVALPVGKSIAIPVRLELVRGDPQQIKLDFTNWESVGLIASIYFSEMPPGKPWKADLMIRASANTPPGSYLFTVRGSTKGTFHTSQDAVTVVVEPREKKDERESEKQPGEEEGQEGNFQPRQAAQPGGAGEAAEPSPSFMDKLFQPSPRPVPGSGELSVTGNAPYEGGLSPGIIAAVVIGAVVIIFSIIMMGGGFGATRNCVGGQISGWPECTDCSGNYERTTYNGRDYGMCRATKVRTDNHNLCIFSCK